MTNKILSAMNTNNLLINKDTEEKILAIFDGENENSSVNDQMYRIAINT